MGKPPSKAAPSRAERQAAALRANLKRRKAGRTPEKAAENPSGDAPPPDPPRQGPQG